jgi:hypothetical protein
MTDPRQFAPSFLRNRDPILAVLRCVLPAEGLTLELASGSGEHVVHFAAALPRLSFQPSDPNPQARASIDAHAAASGLANLRPALDLDAALPPWPLTRADAAICVNMIHISPWAATEGLLRGAALLLPQGAPLFLYGPFLRAGVETAQGNVDFDAWLKAQDARWGLRDLADVAALACDAGFSPPQVVEMPANNLSVIFRKI